MEIVGRLLFLLLEVDAEEVDHLGWGILEETLYLFAERFKVAHGGEMLTVKIDANELAYEPPVMNSLRKVANVVFYGEEETEPWT